MTEDLSEGRLHTVKELLGLAGAAVFVAFWFIVWGFWHWLIHKAPAPFGDRDD